MAYKLKKDHLTNWDVQESNEKPIFNNDHDSYISERSSITSLNENTLVSSPTNKRLPTPPYIPKKEPHSLQYYYNELPENGMPLATQVNHERKKEKKRKKAFRKAPPGQGNLVPLPETNPSGKSDNYYPYWYYYKVKNPDWIMRHRQTVNGQLIPYDYIDPSQYAHEPTLTNSSKKPHRHKRKSHRQHHQDASIKQYNPDKQRYEIIQKVPPTTFPDNYEQQRSSSKQHKPLKDAHNAEHSDQPNKQRKSPRHGKMETENEWNDNYIRSMTNKSSQDSDNLTVNSGTSMNRSKHHSKNFNSNSFDGNKKHHSVHPQDSPHHSQQQHHHHSHSHAQHHHHHHSSAQSQQHHHHHHHHHSASKEYIDTEFQVIDASFKKSERSSYFQQIRNPIHLPPPAIYNQDSHLPPITHDYHHRPNPTDYYNTQIVNKDRKDSIKSPKIYKTDPQTKFYDRYLNNIIDKRLIV